MRQDESRAAEAAEAASLAVRSINALVRLGGALATLMILGVFCIVAVAIVRRYFFNAPLMWGDQFVGYVLVAIVMLGAAEAFRKGDHIAIDLLSSRFGPHAARWLDIFASLAVLAFAVVLGMSTWGSIRFAYDFGSYSIGYIEIATWVPQLPMLAGSVLLGLAAVARLLDRITGGKRS
ncbi:TRAP-type C4-dicarboxylate transport system permease small subunit [Hoeflea marina]|uniref:TRAP transporter small permease protein n=1 Tax=Hoeflea marina TaxID=274592 RepID=A0A317PIM0_9HYPH|nr:TRAP transporter small permease [Hoeflea marina]PWW00292.1 TRAP-type C4-dicarboxylate transport system permease small subunit [Hoeflea marina]